VKVRYALVLLLAFALMVGVACFKTTGGGWFIDQEGNKITFGFTAQPVGEPGDITQEAKGKFQLVDHGTKTRIHGTFTTTFTVSDTPSTESFFWGPCTVNGVDGYSFYVMVSDYGEPALSAGDEIEIKVMGEEEHFHYGFLRGGNIQIHKNHKK